MMTYSECSGLSVYELLLKMRERYNTQTAFSWRCGDQRFDISYKEFVADVLKMAYGLDQYGCCGKRVIISGRNRYEEIVCLYAAAVMGAAAAIINFDMNLIQLREEIRRLAPAMVICEEEDYELIQGHLQTDTFYLPLPTTEVEQREEGGWLFENRKQYRPQVSPNLEAPALLLMTSGSTGKSKWAVLPQRVFWPHGKTPAGRQLLVLPLYHVAAICFISDNLCQGGCLCLSDLKNGILDAGWFRPQLVIAVPAYLVLMMKKAAAGELNLSYFEMIGSVGAPQNMETARYFADRGISSPSFYGATETMGFVTYDDGQFNKKGSVGKVGEWNQVRISENGEILIKGSFVMSGYLDDPEEEKEAMVDGWYRTGDLGFIDEDGFLFLTGRMKNIIILSNGENVNPELIETVILSCDGVEEVMVRGEKDILAAYIRCREPGDLKMEADVSDFIEKYNKEVAWPQRIRKICFRDVPFQRNELGKLKRF